MQDLKNWTPSSDPSFHQRDIMAFDLDDTLTSHEQLSIEAFGELQRSAKLGFKNVLVTGRPVSWADALLRLLPFEAVVAENGAAVFWKSSTQEGFVERVYRRDSEYVSKYEGMPHKEDLESLKKELFAKYPELRMATDQEFRFYDYAFDFAEAVRPALSFEVAEKIKEICENHGFMAKVSNIHVNVWKGNFSKLEGLQFLIEKTWGRSMNTSLVYVGDSPNDGPLFEAVELSVGVANVKKFIESGNIFSKPRFVTSRGFGEGAAELLRHRISYKI